MDRGAMTTFRGRVAMARHTMSFTREPANLAKFQREAGVYADLETMLAKIDLGVVEFREDHTEPPIGSPIYVQSRMSWSTPKTSKTRRILRQRTRSSRRR